MSDIYYSSLCSVKEHLMSTYFGAELGELLTGNKSPVKTGYANLLMKLLIPQELHYSALKAALDDRLHSPFGRGI